MDLIYQTQKELRGFGIYSDVDIEAFAKEYFKPGKQDLYLLAVIGHVFILSFR